MHLRVQLTREGFLMFHPDHRIAVTPKGHRMPGQVDGQSCSVIQLQPDRAGAAARRLRCFSQGCVPPAEPIPLHCWRCQSPPCTGSFHSSSRNLKSFKTCLEGWKISCLLSKNKLHFHVHGLVIWNNSLDEGKGKTCKLKWLFILNEHVRHCEIQQDCKKCLNVITWIGKDQFFCMCSVNWMRTSSTYTCDSSFTSSLS